VLKCDQVFAIPARGGAFFMVAASGFT